MIISYNYVLQSMKPSPLILTSLATLGLGISASAATLAVNFYDAVYTGNTGIQSTENTNALNTAVGISDVTWYNQAINPDASVGRVSGRGSGIYTSVTVNSYSANVWYGGNEGVTVSDASQQVFRAYLDDGAGANGYAANDGIGASIHISGISQYLTANNATSYILTMFFSSDTSNNTFTGATVRSGAASGTTAISSLPVLGTTSTVLLGDGAAPTGTGSGGTRAYGVLGGLVEDAITISMPNGTGTTRQSVAGFAITAVPEPNGTSLAGLALGAYVLRRRRKH